MTRGVSPLLLLLSMPCEVLVPGALSGPLARGWLGHRRITDSGNRHMLLVTRFDNHGLAALALGHAVTRFAWACSLFSVSGPVSVSFEDESFEEGLRHCSSHLFWREKVTVLNI